ncbi:MAG: DNA translocase FtsK 4TM domain-containing protein [Deltaproteobacteria bacterium]|nr:DNA translocase FtsK 4TM domain-containing protein [Deltaproteobacteria bacterium]
MGAQIGTKNLRGEILGLVFLALAIFASTSLSSYSRLDPSFENPSAYGSDMHNLLGRAGSYTAGLLFALFGFSAFWIPVLLFMTSFRMFVGRPFVHNWAAVLGSLILLLASAGLFSLGPRSITLMDVDFPAKSFVGTILSRSLTAYLGRFGTCLVLLTSLLVAVVLCTSFSLVGFSHRTAALADSARVRLVTFLMKRSERKKKKRQVSEQAKRMPREKPRVVEVEPEPIAKEDPPKQKQQAFDFMPEEGKGIIPPLELLDETPVRETKVHRESLEMNSKILEKKLLDFGVQGRVVEVVPGPVITMFEFEPAPGVKISKITGLADDLALALRAESIRIVAPLPGKGAIGIEIPNPRREIVYLKEILSSETFSKSPKGLAIALGKDIVGHSVVTDLTRMPHLLIAGATGTGKSVSLNAMVLSLLYRNSYDRLRLLMIDPKRIELSVYEGIPHLIHPVVTSAKKATIALKWAVGEMERRYRLLSELSARNLEGYNKKFLKSGPPENTEEKHSFLPYIVVVIDELADLMMVSSKDVEDSIARLAQMARASGIHLILATQRPSVDVLTGVIKANFPTRISFQVSSKTDSRTILDTNGAEKLLGAGDMLFLPPGTSKLQRIHGAYVSDKEIREVAEFLKQQSPPDYVAELEEVTGQDSLDADDGEMDEHYEEAVRIVTETRQASISMLQRRLRVGYNRAARMIELMEQQGIVGPSDGVRPRKVLENG